MSSYNVVFPLAKRDQYLANETVDFVISLAGKKLVPNSFHTTQDMLKWMLKPTIIKTV